MVAEAKWFSMEKTKVKESDLVNTIMQMDETGDSTLYSGKTSKDPELGNT